MTVAVDGLGGDRRGLGQYAVRARHFTRNRDWCTATQTSTTLIAAKSGAPSTVGIHATISGSAKRSASTTAAPPRANRTPTWLRPASTGVNPVTTRWTAVNQTGTMAVSASNSSTSSRLVPARTTETPTHTSSNGMSGRSSRRAR
jgi:hypothetical protein